MKRKPRKSLPHYTYRQFGKEEEKVIFKRMTLVLVASAVLLTIIWFWGTSFVNLLGILAKPEEQNLTTPTLELPIAKPTIIDLPETTNSEKISITGRTTAEKEVILESLEGTTKTTSEKDGSFTFKNVTLKKGLNLIKVYVLDSDGNKLEENLVITFDNTPPVLEILQPKDGQNFPEKTETIKILGKTEPEAEVFINALQAIVDPQGQFTFSYPAGKGPLKLDLKATDKAGNSKKVSLTVDISND
ncbi:MAG: Ig-like domain repeat protein [Candidatus Woykebacteria bacterium]